MTFHATAYSPVGWYIVTVIARFEREDANLSNDNRRCLAWENTYLVKASNIDQAYDKVMEHEKQNEKDKPAEIDGHSGSWIVEGITDIAPIYEDIEDLSEILWTEHKNIAVKTVKKKVYQKQELIEHYSLPPNRYKE